MALYSPGGLNLADTTAPLIIAFDNTGTTDVVFAASASGDLTITPDGSKITVAGELVVTGTGPHAIGGATDAQHQTIFTGAFTPSSWGSAVNIASTITGAVDQDIFGLLVRPALTEAASGTHGVVAALQVDSGNMVGAGAATTTAAIIADITTIMPIPRASIFPASLTIKPASTPRKRRSIISSPSLSSPPASRMALRWAICVATTAWRSR